MPANILDPGNERIRDIINLPDSRLQLINFGIIDDGATSLNFQFQGADILTIESDGDFTFAKDISLAGSLTFLNAGAGGNPVLSSNSDDTTLTLAGNLEMPGTNAIKFDSWDIFNETTNGIRLNFKVPNGGEIGRVRYENDLTFGEIQLTNNTFGIEVKQEPTAPIASDKVVYAHSVRVNPINDVATGIPIIRISALLEGPADIVNRPFLHMRNNATVIWTLDPDGTVTQEGDLVMGDNAISFQDWQVQHVTLGDNVLEFKIINEGNGQFNFTTKEISVQTFLVDGNFLCEVLQNTNTPIDKDEIPFNTSLLINSLNDDGSAPLMVFNASPFINNRSLFEIQNQNNTRWNLDNDGTVTQSGNLVMGINEIQFEDEDTFIHAHDDLLKLHVPAGKQIQMVLGNPTSGFTYQFGSSFLNFGERGIANMGQLQFGVGVNVTIQRGTANTNSLELDANTGGEIVLRVSDEEEYNFASTIATFNFNNLTKVGLLDCRSFKIIGLKDVTTPNIATFFDQTIPTADTEIFGWTFNGVSADGTDEIPYAEIFVNQEDITDLTPKGSIDFNLSNGTAIGPVPFITMDGAFSRLSLQKGVTLGFLNNGENAFLTLKTNENDLLTFQDQIVKTQAVNQTKFQDDPIQIDPGGGQVFSDLAVSIPLRPGGQELIVFQMQIVGAQTNNSFLMRVIDGGTPKPFQEFQVSGTRVQMHTLIYITNTDTSRIIGIEISNSTPNKTTLSIAGDVVSTPSISRTTTMRIS